MCVCMCMYIYIHTHICICMYMYVCIYVYSYICRVNPICIYNYFVFFFRRCFRGTWARWPSVRSSSRLYGYYRWELYPQISLPSLDNLTPPPPGESSSAVAADNCRCCPALNYNVSHITMLVSFFQRWQWRRGCLSGARCLSASALERSSVAAETRYVMNTNLICVSSVPWNRE